MQRESNGHVRVIKCDKNGNPTQMEDDWYFYVHCGCGRMASLYKSGPHSGIRPRCGHCFARKLQRECEANRTFPHAG